MLRAGADSWKTAWEKKTPKSFTKLNSQGMFTKTMLLFQYFQHCLLAGPCRASIRLRHDCRVQSRLQMFLSWKC